MKKITTLFLGVILLTFLVSCQDKEIVYTDNEPFTLEIKGDRLKILQITDLHLMFGIDDRDQKTFELIRNLAMHDDYDLIVISGDLTMSPQAPRLFTRLINVMESLKTPWTFIFGNHETDFHDYQDFLSKIKDTEYLYFKVGPFIEDGGVGNFKINFTKDDQLFYHAYFLDSKAERYDDDTIVGDYDYINSHQVSWYEELVTEDIHESIVFMHMPLLQFDVTEGYVGIYNEKQVYAQGKDEGFFDMMVTHDKSKAVFVGHDHLNDFYVMVGDIMLAYGRVTGYNAYGNLPKGGRHIEITVDGVLSTSIIIMDSEVNHE
jgi:predicted MPP superfamily phosphohydrolase